MCLKSTVQLVQRGELPALSTRIPVLHEQKRKQDEE